jgi:Ca2+-binding EF-hand superfamily protein
MPLIALIVASVASVATPPASTPIMVVGHAWAPFISPMGEPFRARTKGDDTLALWFNQADRNHDGMLTADEMQADADRFFATLDTNHDGEIDPEELVRYEWELAPEIQVNSRKMRAPGEPVKPQQTGAERSRKEGDWDRDSLGKLEGLQGGARYALLNIPEPVAAADVDLNRGVTQNEFRQAAVARFQLLDSGRHGKLTFQELNALRLAIAPGDASKRRKDDPDMRYGVSLPPGD